MNLAYVGLGLIFVSLFLPWGGPQTLISQKAQIVSFLPQSLGYLLIFVGYAVLAYLAMKKIKAGFWVGLVLLVVTVGFLGLNLIIRCQEVTCTFNDLGLSPIAAIAGLAIYTYSFKVKN
jgi:hypothetical protein